MCLKYLFCFVCTGIYKQNIKIIFLIKVREIFKTKLKATYINEDYIILWEAQKRLCSY